MEQTMPAAAANPGAAIVASQSAIGATSASPAPDKARSFAFGEPEAVLDRREFLSYAEAHWNGRWYEPPIPFEQLARTRFMSPHHSSAMAYKVNQLVRLFEPTRWLSRRDFENFALNYIAMGQGYLLRSDNLAGRPLSLANQPALYVRRGRAGAYWWVTAGMGMQGAREFPAGAIVHIAQPDLGQELYGVPEWLAALQSGLLNEAATVFRRRYFKNGSHAGYILYVADEKFADEDADALAEAVENSKGPGNFRNIFLHIPNGKEKGVQVIPVGEAAAKDEFLGIKNTTRDDVLAAHRVPPVLIGVVPQVNGGFGKPGEAADVFHTAEIEPLMMRMLEVNDAVGVEAVRFREYQLQARAGKR